MFARVLTFQFRSDPNLEAQMSQMSQANMPVLREQKGFIKLYQLLDRTTGRGLQMHLGETEADLEAYLNSPAFQTLQARAQEIMQDYRLAPPDVAQYEVVSQS